MEGDGDEGSFVLFKQSKAPKELVNSNNNKNISEEVTESENGTIDTSAGNSTPEITVAADLDPSKKTFTSLGLHPWQVETLKGLSITAPTLIQQACIPEILAGRNVIGGAKTGSGKTAAFALPILKALSEDIYGPFAVVLTPTRELALQIAEQFQVLGKAIRASVSVILGGMDMMKQAVELSRRPHIIIATPGRLCDLLESSGDSVDLRRCRFIVLDEADRLLDPQSTFQTLKEIPRILDRVNPKAQHLLFTATLSEDVENFPKFATKPFIFKANEEFGTVDRIVQKYLLIPSKVRDAYLYHLLQTEFKDRTAIIFVSKCRTCELLRFMFRELGMEVAALHSQLSQKDRIAALTRFKSGQLGILLSTDVGSRGLDIPTVQLVINYDVPLDARDYVHRIGRTARAGRGGLALTLMTEMDVDLVQNIETKINKTLEELEPEPKEDEVLERLNKVSDAKRAASLLLMDRKFGEAREINKKKWQKAAHSHEKN